MRRYEPPMIFASTSTPRGSGGLSSVRQRLPLKALQVGGLVLLGIRESEIAANIVTIAPIRILGMAPGSLLMQGLRPVSGIVRYRHQQGPERPVSF